MKRLAYTFPTFAHHVINLKYDRHRLIGGADVLTFSANQLNGVWRTNYLLTRNWYLRHNSSMSEL